MTAARTSTGMTTSMLATMRSRLVCWAVAMGLRVCQGDQWVGDCMPIGMHAVDANRYVCKSVYMPMLRVSEDTHILAKRFAEKRNISIQEVIERAMASYEENEFFRELNEQFAALTPEERAEDAAELALWDGTLMDGLEDEPWEES